MNQLQALYRLQRIDSDMDVRRKRIREINAELEEDTVLRDAQNVVEELENQLRPNETRLADLNHEIQTTVEQTKQLNAQLYDGSVSNPKELEDIQNKIAERERYHASLEEQVLETMMVVEELQASLAAANEQLAMIKTTWENEHTALIDENKRLKREYRALKSERETAEEAVEAAHLTQYTTLRKTKRGLAVAVLERDTCSVCRVAQTSNIVQQVRKGQEFITCSGCGRILVAV